MKIDCIIEKLHEKCEIRAILARKFKMSGTMIKKLKLYGKVELNGVHARVIDTVSEGDRLYCEYEDNSIPLNRNPGIPILFENGSYAVIDKPAGMVTHPGHGHLDDVNSNQVECRMIWEKAVLSDYRRLPTAS